MRGTTLNVLIQMLRRELRVAESAALGKNSRESYAHALRSAQERLFSANDWPFKIIRRDVTIQAGQRYYGLPEDLNMEDLRSANVLYSGQWTPVRRGITVADYNINNPDDNSRIDPVEKWDFYNDPDNGDMLEVWPLPASNGSLLRFEGVRKLSPLVQDTDTCDLDDLLIVLTAAVDFTPEKRLKVAEAKASSHLFSLKRNLSDGATFVSGGGCDPNDRRGQPPRIVISSSASGG